MCCIDLNVPEAQSSPAHPNRRLRHYKVLVVRDVIESHEVQVKVDPSKLVDQQVPVMDHHTKPAIREEFYLRMSDLCDAIMWLNVSGLETKLSEISSSILH